MEKIKSWFGEVMAGGAGIVVIGLLLLIGIGDLYWLWISIKIGSFWMFVLGFVPPFMVFTGPIGAWALVFGVP